LQQPTRPDPPKLAEPEPALDSPITSAPAGCQSVLTQAWVDRMLAGCKRMHEDEDYRKLIAARLS